MTTESASLPATARGTATAAPTVHPPRAGRAPDASRGAPGRGGRDRPALLPVCADVLAAGLAPVLLPGAVWPPAVLAAQAAVTVLLNARRGLYRPRLTPSALADLPALLVVVLLQWFVTATVFGAHDPAGAIGWRDLFLGVTAQTLLSCALRAAAHGVRARAAARAPGSALVVGGGPVARQAVTVLSEHSEYGLRPVGRVVLGPAGGPEAQTAHRGAVPVLAALEEVRRAVVQNAVRQAFFTEPPHTTPEGAELFALVTRHGCRSWLIEDPTATPPQAYGAAHRTDHLWGYTARLLPTGHGGPVSRAVKQLTDRGLAAVGLLVAAPALAGCALAVRLSDGPGVLFRQERLGLDGRPFTLLKFRTLRPADAHESATRWNVSSDRRMSTVGRLLRRTSLDELPQLWNVLRGDMSLVGPRPERPFFAAQFGVAHPGYHARHRMPAGITGLAQVHGLRGDTSIEDRARFDNRYIATWSPWQDVCVLARTAASLFRLGGS
ncbi:exopolysaccharide biosynthesis polyprenyl glycosylphosphotransferase [uncultured Streptomyces sp.]|uniref:exopolysaccharide biosynthesis polyprenyl glycosylphosphotransferase n=1 Tax=uncultured Streptomyces sp. TaxID=174707 RepID=UPI00262BF832|nr:exopolysaccharide biosynthesis polyprenyl glycosylphosphotransferase [uncultured Streptomyces sp.]